MTKQNKNQHCLWGQLSASITWKRETSLTLNTGFLSLGHGDSARPLYYFAIPSYHSITQSEFELIILKMLVFLQTTAVCAVCVAILVPL